MTAAAQKWALTLFLSGLGGLHRTQCVVSNQGSSPFPPQTLPSSNDHFTHLASVELHGANRFALNTLQMAMDDSSMEQITLCILVNSLTLYYFSKLKHVDLRLLSFSLR